MILKSKIIENNLSTLKDYNPIIFYGENEGLKNDLKEQIKIKAKTAEIITLFSIPFNSTSSKACAKNAEGTATIIISESSTIF